MGREGLYVGVPERGGALEALKGEEQGGGQGGVEMLERGGATPLGKEGAQLLDGCAGGEVNGLWTEGDKGQEGSGFRALDVRVRV